MYIQVIVVNGNNWRLVMQWTLFGFNQFLDSGIGLFQGNYLGLNQI
jgi:hypothetical protein